MAHLGTPFRVYYESKNFRTGLTDIIAKVLRPDLTVYTTLYFTEVAQLGFAGLYTAVINTPTNEMVGEWLMRVASPSEPRIDDFRIEFTFDPTPVILAELVALRENIGLGASMGGRIVGGIRDSGNISGQGDSARGAKGLAPEAADTIGKEEREAAIFGKLVDETISGNIDDAGNITGAII